MAHGGDSALRACWADLAELRDIRPQPHKVGVVRQGAQASPARVWRCDRQVNGVASGVYRRNGTLRAHSPLTGPPAAGEVGVPLQASCVPSPQIMAYGYEGAQDRT